MFIVVHSKEFQAPFLIVSEQGLVNNTEERRAYLTFWDALEHGRKIPAEKLIVCHKKKMKDGTYFSCCLTSSITDSAGRNLPFVFCFKKEDKWESFSPHLGVLTAKGYSLKADEIRRIEAFIHQLQKKNWFLKLWDMICFLFGGIKNEL